MQPALVDCAHLQRHPKRAIRVGITRLALDVSPRRLHARDRDGRRDGAPPWALIEQANSLFWNPLPLDELMADVAPLDPDEHFDIPDLSEEEWQTFVAALEQ